MKIISSLRYLVRQGLPLRGHENDQDSNFKQLLSVKLKMNLCFQNG